MLQDVAPRCYSAAVAAAQLQRGVPLYHFWPRVPRATVLWGLLTQHTISALCDQPAIYTAGGMRGDGDARPLLSGTPPPPRPPRDALEMGDYGALDSHPFFPSHVASGRCFLSAAAAGAPAGVVSAFAEPSGWCAEAVLVAADAEDPPPRPPGSPAYAQPLSP